VQSDSLYRRQRSGGVPGPQSTNFAGKNSIDDWDVTRQEKRFRRHAAGGIHHSGPAAPSRLNVEHWGTECNSLGGNADIG
jgi:hypothetical protein